MSEEKVKKEIYCYTDGACSYNPGVGGYGIVLLDSKQKILSAYYGGESYTTNNRMELTAVIEAINLAKSHGINKINIFSDSAYVVEAYNKNWIRNWINKGWVTSSKQPVKNKDLWKKFLDCSNDVEIIMQKVKGHSGEKFNELVDSLAVKACQDIEMENLTGGATYNVSLPKNK